MCSLRMLYFRREVHLRGAVSTRVSTETGLGVFVGVSGVRVSPVRNLQTRGTPSRSPAKPLRFNKQAFWLVPALEVHL